jgi:hypothetical protein
MSGPADVAGDQLRTIVERIEQVEEEIRELTEAKKEIFFEAKGNGFDVKVLSGGHSSPQTGPERARRARDASRHVHASHKGNSSQGEGRVMAS